MTNEPVDRDSVGPSPASLPCASCGYDLRGSLASDKCPECEHAIAESIALARRGPNIATRMCRVFRRHYVAAGLTAFGLAIALGSLLSYRERTSDYYCPLCARVRWQHTTGLAVPFTDLWVVEVHTRTEAFRPDTAISRHLDPAGNCTHDWVLNSAYDKDVFGPRGPQSRRDVTSCACATDEDMLAFLRELPNASMQLTEHIRERDLCEWLPDVFDRWDREREEVSGADSTCAENLGDENSENENSGDTIWIP